MPPSDYPSAAARYVLSSIDFSAPILSGDGCWIYTHPAEPLMIGYDSRSPAPWYLMWTDVRRETRHVVAARELADITALLRLIAGE